MESKIVKLLERHKEVELCLAEPDVFENQARFKSLSQEHSYLSEIKATWESILSIQKQLSDNQQLLASETDADFASILREDSRELDNSLEKRQRELEDLLVPPDPKDDSPLVIELRAGTGGDEAALFVGDCVRMYKLFADHKGLRYELLSSTPSDQGGFKEYVMAVAGKNAYRLFRYEGGTHRVQRVPETEAQGRVHTSAITIAVLLEPEESESTLDEKDLRIDTYRSSGAGGQHVNTTDSAVRITHKPTGIIVAVQDERSQHKNRDKAMRLLKAKIADYERQKAEAAQASDRAMQVGSGDRSERIRTYNFPQNRVTEHRINLTRYNLDQVMNGALEDITSALVAHYRQQQLIA
jgi:peptide chain release factor 1